MRSRRRFLGLSCAAALLAAALPLAAEENTDFTVPPYAGPYQPVGADERGLWSIDDENERLLRDSRLVITDEALNAYVRGVLCRTVGDDRCNAVRIYILRMPYFNASMSPNGTMRVYSGLLLRVKNEAELASVLGHEFAHFELRHTLTDFKRQRTGSDILAWTALLGAVAARYGSGYSTSMHDSRVSIYGALARYNRDQEREADIRGFGYLTLADYRPSAAAEIWRANMNEADRSAQARSQRTTRYDALAYFASHPTNLERADYLSALANRVAGGEIEGTDRLMKAVAPWRSQFLEDQLKLNDFGASEYLLERLAADNWTPDLLFARGELHRARGNPRDLVNSAGFYRDALTKDPELVDAYRGLGLALMRTGQVTEGKEALTRYLQANPDAADAQMLTMMVEQ